MRTRAVAPDQASLDELLEKELDGEVSLPFRPEDIGGELVAILSKGLYTNPLAALREYVQNAVDGEAKRVVIKVTGNSLLITDDGRGMTLDQLVAARQFGLSPKVYAENVGFRGIGVYSGFDLCRLARIHSKSKGSTRANVLVFDFQGMRERLDAARLTADANIKPTLIDLITEYSWFSRDDGTYPLELEFTHVDLQDLSPDHVKRLSNSQELSEYLLQALPIDFHRDFTYRDEINRRLAENVPGYHPITIELQIEGQPALIVEKAPIDGLQSPQFGYATVNKRQVAFFWASLNGKPERVLSRSERAAKTRGRSKYAGFAYKVKGFTIGDREKLRPMFRVQDFLYYWYTGEIYVLDDNVLPNAERDDFETSPASEGLKLAVARVMEDLLKQVQKFQQTEQADQTLDRHRSALADLQSRVDAGSASPADVFATVNTIKEDLKRRRGKLGGQDRRDNANDLSEQADQLLKTAERSVSGSAGTGRRPSRETPAPPSAPAQTALFPAPNSLLDVLAELNVDSDSDAARVAGAVQQTLEEMLPPDVVSRILSAIRDRLLDGSDG